MSTRAAAKKVIDWSNLSVALKLKPETSASLSAFRKRHEELQRTVATLQEARSDIDFNHYRSILKNKKVVDDAEKALKAFAPAKYDLQAQLKVIHSFEAKALDRARKTADQVSTELKDLKDTLENIDKARPLDELTVSYCYYFFF
ncbi:hypothetical protein BKA69DRAFT_1062753 [Paraphysoderma sedebokerense]|nr:hypothetical protein BKA69DRAFT_1062753 [Paraphysoderma sedebokerense]